MRNNSTVKYLKLSQTFNSTLFLPSSHGELCVSSPKYMYLEYLDADKMRRSVEKNYLKYLEADKMRGKVEESLMAPFNEP